MTITTRQDQPVHFERLVSYTYRYGIAGRWRSARMLGTLVLAGLVPVLAYADPDAAAVLGAVAAAWLVLGRTILRRCEQASYRRAALVQEFYDTQLFELEWNGALAGAEPNVADMTADAMKLTKPKKRDALRVWYDVDLTGLPWPVDVLTCQLQSSIWSRRDHRAYALFLGTTATAWLLAGVVYAGSVGMSLTHFLVALFLPSAPALTDAAELTAAHWQQFGERLSVELDAQKALQDFHHGGVLPSATLVRSVQDHAYRLRRDQPRVPRWFYSLRKSASALVTRTAAQAVRLRRDDREVAT